MRVRNLVDYSKGEADVFVTYLLGRAKNPNDSVARDVLGLFFNHTVEEFIQGLEKLKTPENAAKIEMLQSNPGWIQEAMDRLKAATAGEQEDS